MSLVSIVSKGTTKGVREKGLRCQRLNSRCQNGYDGTIIEGRCYERRTYAGFTFAGKVANTAGGSAGNCVWDGGAWLHGGAYFRGQARLGFALSAAGHRHIHIGANRECKGLCGYGRCFSERGGGGFFLSHGPIDT